MVTPGAEKWGVGKVREGSRIRPRWSGRRLMGGGTMRYAVVGVMLAGSIAGLLAQTPATRPIEESRFDVVSIKPISRESPMWRLAGYSPDPTRFHGWFGYTDLLSMGYQIQPNRIVGLPKWTADERYEITA